MCLYIFVADKFKHINNKSLFNRFSLSLYFNLLIVFIAGVVFMSGCRTTKYVPEGKHLVRKVEMKCDNDEIDQDELTSYIKQNPNRRLLKVFPMHLKMYNLVNPEKEAVRMEKRKAKLEKINEERRWKGKEPKEKFYFTEWIQDIGEAPVIYDDYLTSKTTKQFNLYLRNKGYYNPEIHDTVYYRGKKAFVSYTVKTNQPYKYRKISYDVPDYDLLQLINNDTVASLLKTGKLFDIDVLENERQRITYNFKKQGYYAFLKEYIDYRVDTSLVSNKADLIIRVRNPTGAGYYNQHYKYRIGNIYIYTGFDPKLAIQQKDTYFSQQDTLSYKGYNFIYNDDLLIKPDVLLRAISIIPGDTYDIRNVEKTYGFLSSLQIFKLSNILFIEEDDKYPDGNTKTIDCIIQLTPFTTQSTIVELEGTNTSGNFGIASNLKYVHKSLFKGAELFEVKFKGAMQVQSTVVEVSQDEGIVSEVLPFNTLELGPETSIYFPKLLLPWKMEAFTKSNHPRSVLTSSYNYMRRPDFSRIILTGKMGYSWKNSRNILHALNPIELNYIRLTDISDEFRTKIRNSYFRNSYQDQLISASNYTFSYSSQDIKKRTNFVYLKTVLETSGNTLAAFSRLSGTAQPLGERTIYDVKYAQYFKVDIDFSYHRVFGEHNKVVYRNFIGVGFPYGNSDGMPFIKQYFSGGANSIRAWPVRSLGPGSLSADSLSTFFNQTADIKLEANIEYRFDLFWVIEGALFMDVGNIWAMNDNLGKNTDFKFDRFYKELAAGGGIGARFDFDFFILRLDFGYRIMDPAEEDKFVLPYKRFRDSHAWNIAIGYPF